MADFDSTTAWATSHFGREQRSGSATSLLGSTLLAELHGLSRQSLEGDVLHVFAACVRLREPALVRLGVDGQVWPVTLFPREMFCHSAQSIVGCADGVLARVRVIGVEPPDVPAPTAWMPLRRGSSDAYRPLVPALWHVALNGPTATLLREIGGTAAYRVLRAPAEDGLPTTGALGPAVEHLRRESMALRHVARLPGMSVARASRLLNALYLSANLVVARSHPAARPQVFAGAPRG